MELQKIAQDNRITTARYELSLIEKRIVYQMIKEIRSKFVLSDDGQRTLFDNMVLQIKPSLILKAGTRKEEVKAALKSLRLRSFEYDNGVDEDSLEHHWLEVGFINYGEWREDLVEIEVSKKILPFFVELSKEYTEFSLTIAMSLRSKWSQRFYELCSKWKHAGGFKVKYQELRDMLVLNEKYSKPAAFKLKIIDVAHKELKALYDEGVSDLYFEYTIKKNSRSFDSFSFKIISSTKEEMKLNDDDISYFVRTELRSLFKTDKMPKNYDFVVKTMGVLNMNVELLHHCYGKLQFAKTSIPQDEIARYMRFVINDEYLENN